MERCGVKDNFGREITYLRISVTERCNLRCRYCMPEEGICKMDHAQMLSQEERVMAVRAAAACGINKVRITGGEPLVKKNILSICESVAAVPGIREVCLTTNAMLLPGMAQQLRNAGVGRINISLDTLDPEKYQWITRRGTLREALAGLDAALRAGFSKVKINSVLIGGFNDDEIPALASLSKDRPVDVRFIELMPMSENLAFGKNAYISYKRVLEVLPELEEMPADGGVAKLYRLPDAQGNIGLISPISAHFCGTCNRLRLTSDGRIKPCLHSAEEYPVKGLSEEEMKKQFEVAILGKPEWHGELSREIRSRAARSMNQIGG